jgi:hypothetical protein
MTARLSSDLDDLDAVPYFLWDQPMTLGQFKEKLGTGSTPAELRLLGKLMREARDSDVWRFTTPDHVLRVWPDVSRFLGQRRPFWDYLLGRWREDGLVGAK